MAIIHPGVYDGYYYFRAPLRDVPGLRRMDLGQAPLCAEIWVVWGYAVCVSQSMSFDNFHEGRGRIEVNRFLL